jgi:hypothetical protein
MQTLAHCLAVLILAGCATRPDTPQSHACEERAAAVANRVSPLGGIEAMGWWNVYEDQAYRECMK